MSWFKRSPRVKEPPKQAKHKYSPMTEKILEEAKEKVREKKTSNKSTK